MNKEKKYMVYTFSPVELISYVVLYLFLLCIVSILFYNSIFMTIIFSPVLIFFMKKRKKYLARKQQIRLRAEFREMIGSLSANLGAGYALEKAFYAVYEEMQDMYQGKSYIEKELKRIIHGISINKNVEDLLLDFGERSGIKDIKDFANVVAVAKRTGGNMVQIIKTTAENMSKRQEVLCEIETMVSGKLMEQRIMSVMPFAIIVYMRTANSGYMDSLYGSAAGGIVMTICLFISVLAILWGRRIVEIEV